MSGVSLLPPNATEQERALEGATARLGAVSVPVRRLWDPWTCPAGILPWLAWSLSVDDWDPDWTEAQKRAAVAESVEVHRRKGTVGAVRRALQAIGYEVFLTEREDGPFTFRLYLDASKIGIEDSGVYAKATAIALRHKNARSHLAGVGGYLDSAGTASARAVTLEGFDAEVRPPLVTFMGSEASPVFLSAVQYAAHTDVLAGPPHPAAADWLARVRAYGADASPSTLAILSQMFHELDYFGVRNRIQRLNVFAGNNLTAATIPQITSAQFPGIQLSPTDSIAGFVQADYAERGLAGGLKGDGATKYIDTGLRTNITGVISATQFSLGVFIIDQPSDQTVAQRFAGARDANHESLVLRTRSGDPRISGGVEPSGEAVWDGTLVGPGLLLVTRSAAATSLCFKGGVLADNETPFGTATTTNTVMVFAEHRGSPFGPSDARLGGYFVGSGLTPAQALALNGILERTMLALSRIPND